jgi:exopolysaccharide production protein ExoQ
LKIETTKVIDKLEWLFAFFVLQLASGSLIRNIFLTGVQDRTEGLATDHPIMQAIWLSIYVVSLVLVLARPRELILVLKREKLLILLVGLALFSYYWSALPAITIRRAFALAGTTLFGIYIVTRYNSHQILKLLVWTLSIGAILSPVVSLAFPSLGISPEGGWQGFYMHKNLMGRLMGLNAVFLLLLIPSTTSKKYRRFMWAGVVLCSCLVFLSTSKGALVSFFVLLTLYYLYKSLQWRYTVAIPFFIISVLMGAIIALLLIGNLETIVVDVLGKDLTFTGRTILWEYVVQMIQQRPILGYGYQGFWRGLDGPSAFVVDAVSWAVPHAHNGFLDLTLNLGIVGLSIFLLSFLMSTIRAVRWLRLTKKIEDLWPLLFLSATLLYNVAESTLLERNHILWILYVITVFARPASYKQPIKPSYSNAVTTLAR